MVDEYFPSDENGMNLMMQTLYTQLPTYKGQIVYDGDDYNKLGEDKEVFAWFLTTASVVSVFSKAFFALKRAAFTGAEGEVLPPMPTIAALVLPFIVMSGIIKRTRSFVQRIKESKGYTKEIGIALGIEKEDDGSNLPDTLAAELSNIRESNGYNVTADFSKKGTDGIQLEVQRKGSQKWSVVTRVRYSPAKFEVEPTVEGDVEQVKLRAIYIVKDQPAGGYSPEYPVTIIPE